MESKSGLEHNPQELRELEAKKPGQKLPATRLRKRENRQKWSNHGLKNKVRLDSKPSQKPGNSPDFGLNRISPEDPARNFPETAKRKRRPGYSIGVQAMDYQGERSPKTRPPPNIFPEQDAARISRHVPQLTGLKSEEKPE